MVDPALNVVLVRPEIPPNTGNVGRLCVATGTRLHLVAPLGFELSDTQLKRAGLDYWQFLDLQPHPDLEAFFHHLPENAPLVFFSKKAERSLYEQRFETGSYLIFGNESSGLPEDLLQRHPAKCCRIPMADERVRSLNLSTAVGICLYEAIRQINSKAGRDGFRQDAT